MQHLTGILGVYNYYGEVFESQPHGFGIASNPYNPSDVIYEGQWVNGERHGFGKKFHMEGWVMYEGEWAHDEFEGYGIQFGDANKVLYQGYWKASKFDGEGILFDVNENPEMMGIWQNGILAQEQPVEFEDLSSLGEEAPSAED